MEGQEIGEWEEGREEESDPAQVAYGNAFWRVDEDRELPKDLKRGCMRWLALAACGLEGEEMEKEGLEKEWSRAKEMLKMSRHTGFKAWVMGYRWIERGRVEMELVNPERVARWVLESKKGTGLVAWADPNYLETPDGDAILENHGECRRWAEELLSRIEGFRLEASAEPARGAGRKRGI